MIHDDFDDCDDCLDCNADPCECGLIASTEYLARMVISRAPVLLEKWGDNPNADSYLLPLIADARDVLAWLEIPE